jgi:hypothetical protein
MNNILSIGRAFLVCDALLFSLKHQPVIVPSKVMEGTSFDLYLFKFFLGGVGRGFILYNRLFYIIG